MLRVAVITPYYKEPEHWLLRCIDSVKRQQAQVHIEHIVVADGHPQPWLVNAAAAAQPAARRLRHIVLDCAHADYGNTPRSLGALLAASEGFDAIAYLDGDNWYKPQHVDVCLQAAASAGKPVDWVAAQRHLVREDGSVLPAKTQDEASGQFVDTNCMFMLKGAFHTIARWATMPRALAVVGDRVMKMGYTADGLVATRAATITLNYLCTHAYVFEALGETPPPYAKRMATPPDLVQWHQSLSERERIVSARLCGFSLQRKPPAPD